MLYNTEEVVIYGLLNVNIHGNEKSFLKKKIYLKIKYTVKKKDLK